MFLFVNVYLLIDVLQVLVYCYVCNYKSFVLYNSSYWENDVTLNGWCVIYE